MENIRENKLKIGIVGHGFVGKAVDYGFEHPAVEKFLVDPLYGTTIDDLIDWKPNISFICVLLVLLLLVTYVPAIPMTLVEYFYRS